MPKNIQPINANVIRKEKDGSTELDHNALQQCLYDVVDLLKRLSDGGK